MNIGNFNKIVIKVMRGAGFGPSMKSEELRTRNLHIDFKKMDENNKRITMRGLWRKRHTFLFILLFVSLFLFKDRELNIL